MNNIIQNLSEITDSRELLEAKPHKFTSIFAYGLIVILIIALIWTYFGEIDIVVKTNGIVKSNDKTISVLNEVDGKVSAVSFKEGQKVKKGDILYSLECKDAMLSKKNYDKQLITLQATTNNMDKLRNSILDNKNNFDVNKADEKDYYNKYLLYSTTNEKLLLTQKQTGLQSSITNDNKLISSKSIGSQISESSNVINSLNVLLQSINDNKSKFSDGNSVYSAKYSDYEFNIQSLQNSIQQKKLALQNASAKYTQATTDYQSQIDSTQAAYNNAILKLAQYKSQYIGQIASNITQTTASLNDMQSTIPITQITQIQTSINNLQLLVQSINSAHNLFTDSNSTYYRQYVDYTNNFDKYKTSITDQEAYKNSYLITINQSIDTAQNDLTQLQANSSTISVKAGTLSQTIYNHQLLQSSISKNQNEFQKSNIEYYNKFIDYQNAVEELQNNITIQAKLISSLASKKDAIIDDYSNQLTAAQKVLDGGAIDLSKYENQGVLDVKSKLDEAGNATKNLQFQLDQSKLTPGLDMVNGKLAANDITKYKMDTLVQLDDGIKQNEQKLNELKTNIGSLQLSIDKSTVKSPIDGVVNVKSDISKSQIVKSGQEVLSVIPQNSSQYRVQLYVSNKDIIGMKIGEKIKYHFQALPYREYGEFTGTVTDIAVDSTVDQQSGTSYYLVESEILNKPLYSYKGQKGELRIGMTCEAQVITKRKKILYYLLEKINLKN
ncbi:HlyD family efflux transporter periplasmic adaptor subunit [Clostridium sp.]|uniref:HlyD family efflux transporter periplasmic adaptor subunit n=1 Tax=Clostridium sp. TaxID=1506 RepID=UPI003D6C8DAA